MADISDVTVELADGSRVTLQDMKHHCRPERVQDLLEDLALMCEDVEAGRRPEDRRLSVVRGQK